MFLWSGRIIEGRRYRSAAFFLWQKPLYYVIVFLNINLVLQELTNEQILYFSS